MKIERFPISKNTRLFFRVFFDISQFFLSTFFLKECFGAHGFRLAVTAILLRLAFEVTTATISVIAVTVATVSTTTVVIATTVATATFAAFTTK